MSDTHAPPPVPRWQLVKQDAVELLRRVAGGTRPADLIIMDPAYESIERHRAVGTTTRLKKSKGSSASWFPSFPNARYAALFAAAWDALKAPSHMYVMCDHETMFLIKPIIEAVGFYVWKPVIWDKVLLGGGYHYRECYEVVLFCEKRTKHCVLGDRTPKGKGLQLNDKGHRSLKAILDDRSFVRGEPWPPNMPEYPGFVTQARERTEFSTEKPVRLSELLVLQSSPEGGLVVDPFCGSSSSGRAALLHGRDFIGGDIYDLAHEVSRRNLGAIPHAVESSDLGLAVERQASLLDLAGADGQNYEEGT